MTAVVTTTARRMFSDTIFALFVLFCTGRFASSSLSSSAPRFASGFVIRQQQHMLCQAPTSSALSKKDHHARRSIPTSSSSVSTTTTTTNTAIYFTDPYRSSTSSQSSTSLTLFRRLRRRWKERRQQKRERRQQDEQVENSATDVVAVVGDESIKDDSTAETTKTTTIAASSGDTDGLVITNTQPMDDIVEINSSGNIFSRSNKVDTEYDLVVVGGGISGLAAAITAAEASSKTPKPPRIALLEATSKFGGRVASVRTDDGYTLDEGFAVFIEEYPEVKKLLDYDALKLRPFLPGALVKLDGRTRFGRVADPIREPADIINSVLSPVGSLIDKMKVLPLVFNVRTKSIEELFEEREVATSEALTDRWGFSDSFISSFLQPFLEGIYLAPLSEQSSRMFSFVFKMFSEGSATLPEGGMQAVTDQLVARAESLGIALITNCPATQIVVNTDKAGGEPQSYIVKCKQNNRRIETPTLVVATDGVIAQKLLSNVPGFESLETLPVQPQLAVGCLYYGFKGEAPVEEPILVLNGIGIEAGTEDYPVNNICFPSVVNKGYAPDGYSLCSVTVLSKAMETYKDRPDDLDDAVRRQLTTWFPDIKNDILDEWEIKKIFYVSTSFLFLALMEIVALLETSNSFLINYFVGVSFCLCLLFCSLSRYRRHNQVD